MNTMDGRENTEVLIDLLRRSPLLEELRDDALDRRELQDRLGVSKATGYRHTRQLCELDVIERTSDGFALTESGELLADALVRFKRDARSALELGPLLEAIRNAPVAVDAEAFAGATVTSAERGDPYSPVARFVSLVHETDTLRGFDMDLIAPFHLVEIQRRIVDGMETEGIALPAVIADSLADYPDKCIEACASGHLTVWLRDDLPFGLAIFDDRVGIGVPERDTRNLRLFVDTASTDVREWADAVYERYWSGTVRLDEYTQGGFQRAMEKRTDRLWLSEHEK